jgi:hypothetical protein
MPKTESRYWVWSKSTQNNSLKTSIAISKIDKQNYTQDAKKEVKFLRGEIDEFN